jgi:U4/U6.U5 tri-snRNP component SNU23
MSGRRTWDKEHYEKLAKERVATGEQAPSSSSSGAGDASKRAAAKEEFKAADDSAAGPMGSSRAFLKAREQHVDLDSKVGKSEIVNPTTAAGARGAGFWCEVCSCLLKDSVAYLDHINGKKHQRALGYSMRTERADVDSVKDRLAALKRKVSAVNAPKAPAIEDYESRLKAQIEEKEATKKRRKDEASEKAATEKAAAAAAEEGGGVAGAGGDGQERDEEQDEMAMMMGFGGFGGSKKKGK